MKDNTILNNCNQKWLFILVQILTLSRIPLAVFFSYFITNLNNLNVNLFNCALILLLCELSDLFDGNLARRFGVVSSFGSMLDPYADSVSRMIVYWSLASVSLANFSVVLIMAIRDITVAYCRIVLCNANITVAARLGGKVKAWIQAIGAFILLFGPLYWNFFGKWTVSVLSWIIIVATSISSIEYLRDAYYALQDTRNSSN